MIREKVWYGNWEQGNTLPHACQNTHSLPSHTGYHICIFQPVDWRLEGVSPQYLIPNFKVKLGLLNCAPMCSVMLRLFSVVLAPSSKYSGGDASSPIAIFDAEQPETKCSIVLILFSIVLAPILRYKVVFF